MSVIINNNLAKVFSEQVSFTVEPIALGYSSVTKLAN